MVFTRVLYGCFICVVTTPTQQQRNLNVVGGWTRKWLCTPPPPPPTQTQCQQYLSCYWPDFDQTLKVGSWEHLEQIPTVRWYLSRQHLSWWHLSISAISQLLLARFWPNFKGRFLGPSLTDLNYHGTFVQATFVLATFVHIRNISADTD